MNKHTNERKKKTYKQISEQTNERNEATLANNIKTYKQTNKHRNEHRKKRSDTRKQYKNVLSAFTATFISAV
jgi:hypothetical protein